jgi:hypothetical protein
MVVIRSRALMKAPVLTRKNYNTYMYKMTVFLSHHACLDMIIIPFIELDDEERDQMNKEYQSLYNEI